MDRRRTEALKAGRALLYEPGLEGELQRALRSGHLRFLHSDEMHDELGDIIVVATGTPSTDSGAADLAQVWHALSWLKTFDLQNRVMLMKSTVPPGTGCAISLELNAHGARYVSNPEFLREGRALEDWRLPDRIVIGVDQRDDRSCRSRPGHLLRLRRPLHHHRRHQRRDDQVCEQRFLSHTDIVHQ